MLFLTSELLFIDQQNGESNKEKPQLSDNEENTAKKSNSGIGDKILDIRKKIISYKRPKNKK